MKTNQKGFWAVASAPLVSSVLARFGVLLLSCLLWTSVGWGQTTLISPSGDGGFENGTTFAANGWTVENYSSINTNKWFVGSVATPSSGSRAAYISNDVSGSTHNYDITGSSRVMFWRDIVFPAGETKVTLTFKVKSNGESSYDDISVFIQNSSIVPSTSTQPSSSGSSAPSITNATNLGTYSALTSFTTQTITINASLLGNSSTSTTRRLIFLWENDASGGTQPPAVIDEVSLTSSIPSSYTWNATTGSALWATATSWTPSRTTPDASDILNFSNGGSSIVQTASGAVGGNIVFANNTTANFQPTAANTISLVGMTIPNGSSMYVNGTFAQTITFTGGTNTIDGRLELSGAAHSISFANTVTTVSSTGVLAAGGATAATITGTSATLIINGTYEHKYTTVSGTLPTATWSDGSNCNIIGYTTTVTAHPSYAQSFWNFTWNCPSQTAAITGSISGSWIVRNNLNLISTGSSGTFTNSGTSTYAIKNINISGGTFNLGSSSSTYTITGDFTKSGGTMTPTGACTFNFAGATAQNISLDALATNSATWRFSNPSGVTITGTGSFPSSFPIGNGTNGGVRISTIATTPLTFAGTITNGFNYNAANSTLTYDATTGSTTARAIEFPSTNGPTNLTVAVGGANVLVLPFSRTISGTLTMTSGDIDISSNNLILGTSSSALGTLTWTAGSIRVTTGTLTRWFGTTGLPTAAGTAIGYFPLAAGVNNRNTSIYFSSATGLTTAGTITVGHTNSGGLSTISTITDGTYNIDTRANSNWTISTGNGIAGSAATLGLRLTGGGMFNTSTVANLRLMQANSIIGTHAAGTGTSPNFQALRTGLTLTQIVNNHYIGAASADMQLVFNSIASGDWNNPSTWDAGSVPVCTGLVNIMSGHNVTVNSSSNNASTTTINAGGTLTISSGDLTIGCTNNNSLLNINGGTLNVSGGTLNVNGKFAVGANTNSVFIQSGGAINVDGNSGTLTTSIDGHIVDMYCHTTSTLQLTGGTFTVVDPTLSATATNCAFKVYPTVAHSSGSGWSLNFGDGVSTNPGGHTGGFLINLTNTNSFAIGGTVTLNSAAATNRIVTTSGAIPLKNLTITQGNWSATSINYISGNLVNNGVLTHATSSSNLVLSSFSGTTASPSSNPQTISGTGIFSNNSVSASKTADLIGLTVNNNNATGVTLNVPLSISGTLTMTSGIINTTSTNLLTLGTATAAGTLACTPSATNFINGPFTRTYPSQTAIGTYTVATLFPVGASATSLPIYIDPTTTAVTKFTANAYASMPGTAGSGVSNLANLYWSAIPDVAANVSSSRIQLIHSNITSTSKLLYAQTNSGSFNGVPGGSSSVATTSVTAGTGINPYYNFYSYGDLITCSAPSDQTTAITLTNKTSTSFTGTLTPASSSPTGYLIVRYASAATPTAPSNNTLYTVGATLGTGTVRGIVYGSPFQFNESGLTASTTYDYYVYSFNNSGCAGPTYNLTSPYLQSITTCGTVVALPTTLTASSVTTTSMVINYTASTTATVTDHILDVSTNSGFTSFVQGYQNLSLGTAGNSGAQTVSISGLTAATTYYIRIKAVDGAAGCESAYTTALTQVTLCNPVTFFSENFENTSGSSFSSCWSKVGSTGSAYPQASTGISGSRNLYIYSGAVVSLPPVSNASAGTNRFKMKVRANFTAGEVINFGYLTNPSDASTFVTLGSITPNSTTIAQDYVLSPVSCPSGITTLALRNGSTLLYSNLIDDIIYEPIPAPSISNVTSSTACGSSTLVTITGTELANATVSIGGTAITLTTNTATQITATVNTAFSGTVQVTTAGGTATSSSSITYIVPPTVTLNNAATQLNCSGITNSTLTTLTSTISNYNSYVWSPSTGIVGDSANGWSFNPTSNQTYTLTATNNSGCTFILTKSISVGAIPSAISLTPNTTQSICAGNIQSIVVSGGSIGTVGDVNIGTSTTQNTSTSYPAPYTNYYGGAKHQMIIRASELTALGLVNGSTINSIGFNVSSIGSTFTGSLSNFQIDMGHTSTSVLSSTSFIAGLTNVLPAATVSIPTTGLPTTKTHTLTTPFVWNGTDNIVIQTSYSNANSGTSTDFVLMTQSDPGFVSTSWYRADAATSASILSAATPTSSGNARPNMILNITNNQPITWSPTTDLYTNAAATTAYTGNPSTVYSKPTANRTYTATATTSNGCTSSASVTINYSGTPLATAPSNGAYVFGATGNTNYNTAANWYTYSSTNGYAIASAVPTSSNVVVIPATGTCVNAQPSLSASASITDVEIQSGAILSLNGNTLSIAGALTGAGTIKGSASSSLSFTGSSNNTLKMDQTTAGTTNVLKNLTLSGTGTTTLGNALNITAGANSGSVTAGAGTTLTTGGFLRLKSDASGTARIAQSAGTISGNVTQERYVPGKAIRKWSFLASPVTQSLASAWQQQIHITGAGTGGTMCNNYTISGTMTPHTNGFDVTQLQNPSFYTYDAATDNFVANTTGTTNYTLTPGVGYMVLVRGDRNDATNGGCVLLSANNQAAFTSTPVTLAATGAVGQGTITKVLPAGFSFIGNPYPCEIDFPSFNTTNASVITGGYWTYYPTNATYTFSTYNNGTSTNGGTQVIANGQSFLVNSTSGGTITFNEAQKSTTANNGNFRLTKTWDELIRVGLSNNQGNRFDEVVVRFGNDAAITKAVNEYDAASVNGGDQWIKTLKETTELAIQTRPNTYQNDTVSLAMHAKNAGTYQLNFSEYQGLSNTEVYLIDQQENLIQNVKALPSYEFSVGANTTTANRFKLIFDAKTSGVAALATKAALQVYPNPTKDKVRITCDGLAYGAYQIKVRSITGAEVLKAKGTYYQNEVIELSLQDLAAGMYMLELTQDNGLRAIQKITKQ
jgi:hypothetical protein